jgi:riboflavin synthase
VRREDWSVIVFTGIIEELGRVRTIGPSGEGLKMVITTRVCGPGLSIGDSLAVNGCCLTIVAARTVGDGEVVGVDVLDPFFGVWNNAFGELDGTVVEVDVLKETWNRTNLQFCDTGTAVNLERPLRADGRWGGHFVTGHVDGIGRVASWTRSGADRLLQIKAPPEILRYIVTKGSIAVDGISLTVAEVREDGFGVWIIPHTFEMTALSDRGEGDAVNLEGDILGKYAEKFLLARTVVEGSGGAGQVASRLGFGI